MHFLRQPIRLSFPPSAHCPASTALLPRLGHPPCRAPLVDAALRAYAGLSPAAWARQQATAFPHLARLVCSPSRGVRRALRTLLQQQVPSVLAAARGGGGGGGNGVAAS